MAVYVRLENESNKRRISFNVECKESYCDGIECGGRTDD